MLNIFCIVHLLYIIFSTTSNFINSLNNCPPRLLQMWAKITFRPDFDLVSVVQKVNRAIHRIVIF